MSFNFSQMGRTWRTEEFRVNTARLAQFAAAIDDENPSHRAGTIASPVFANVPPMQSCIESLHSVTSAFTFHGEHDFHLHRPIRSGMRLFAQAALRGVMATRAGVSVVVHSKTLDEHAVLVDEQYFTAFVARATLPQSMGEAAPKLHLTSDFNASRPFAEATYGVSADQTLRYADAARDYSDYTLRADAARAKGLDNILVHGMLTMAFAGRAVVGKACGGDSTLLRRLAGRFSNPVYLVPNQALTTRIWQLNPRSDRRIFGFETSDASGAVVIKNGVAEVSA
jgi:acyl dehydratase